MILIDGGMKSFMYDLMDASNISWHCLCCGLRYIVSKGPKYRFPSRIDLKKCREEIASALNDFGNRWCKREYMSLMP